MLAIRLAPHFRRSTVSVGLKQCHLCRSGRSWRRWQQPQLQLHVWSPSLCFSPVIRRSFHSVGDSSRLAPAASSKVEETVKRLKEKHMEKLNELQKIQDLELRVKSAIELDEQTSKAVANAKAAASSSKSVAKKSVWQRFVDEVNHYKSGFALLFVDIGISSKIVWKILRGQTLTRRESRQLVRTVGDLFRLVPFLVFVIIPFMEFLLPVALKLFPGMLPSTFSTTSDQETKYRRRLVAKLEYAKFLQKTLDEMAPTDKDRSSQSARDFVNFLREIRDSGGSVDNEKILKFSKLFEDDITLDNMTRNQLRAICRILELPPVGPKNMLAFSIEMRVRSLKADDHVIQREGVENMSVSELQTACKERGMRALGLQRKTLVRQMKEWLRLSLDAKVPPSLLLLSRTLYLPPTLDPSKQLAMTISSLPEAAASRASAEIGMKEGKIRNVDKLEVIKEEQRKIEEEALEKEKIQEVQKEEQPMVAVLSHEELPPTAETVIKEAAEALKEEEQPEVPIGQRKLSVEDFSDVKSAIEKLGKVKTETEEIDELKKELEDYKEDLRDLDSVKEIVQRSGLRESRGAQLLYSRVNKMLGRVGHLVESLESEKKQLEDKLQEPAASETDKADLEKKEKHLVTINELIDSVQHLENTPDGAKVEQIAEVLSLMDDDKDGVIQVDHVMKVIELLGTTHAKLPAKQIRQIAEMLAKEEMIAIEENIEDKLETKSVVEPGDSETDETFEKEIKRLESAAKKAVVDEDDGQVPDHVKEMFQDDKGSSSSPTTEKQKNGRTK